MVGVNIRRGGKKRVGISHGRGDNINWPYGIEPVSIRIVNSRCVHASSSEGVKPLCTLGQWAYLPPPSHRIFLKEAKMASKRSPGFINKVKKDVISKMIEDHKVMLHTQYERSRLSGFKVGDFTRFSHGKLISPGV